MVHALRSILHALGLALTAIVAAALLVSVTPAQRAEAANAWDFQAGNIISDSIFFNSGTMNEGQIQAFLNSKVRSCRAGYTCLKDYREDTRTIPGTPMCGTYDGAPGESAARIILKVAQTCGINPQVIIVMLQKEQGLVADTWPTTSQYRSAMGAGCPDTAACDANYYGFFNQVQYGAYLLKRYTQPPGTGSGTQYSSRFDLSFPVGRTSFIGYNPNSYCGGKNVYVSNQASHVLYVYTPYTPSDAALNSGYGVADNCSAYGNRNFFLYFTDWFGSTQNPVSSAIVNRYIGLGLQDGVLSTQNGTQACGLRDGGCWQSYANGAIYASTSSGPEYILSGPIRDLWSSLGWEHDVGTSLGYPVTDTNTGLRDAGSWQGFQRGAIYSWSRGTFVMRNDPIRAKWASLDYERSSLGYPVNSTDTGLRDGGSWQGFENGGIYTSPAGGTRVLGNGPIRDYWNAQNYEKGPLGYPTSDFAQSADGTWQDFEGATVYRSAGGIVREIPGAIGDLFMRTGGDTGVLGAPIGTADCTLPDRGCSQVFSKATVYGSASTDPQIVPAGTLQKWQSLGGVSGSLGYPVTAAQTGLRDGGAWQGFQHGAIYTSTAGGTVALVDGPIRSKWAQLDYERSPLGYPTADAVTSGGSASQTFEHGVISSDSRGLWTASGDIGDAFVASGGAGGPLGLPTNSADTSLRNAGAWQSFAGGAVYRSAGTGARILLNGSIRDYWTRQDYEKGPLGYPKTALDATLRAGGAWQGFEGGAVYSSPAGTYTVQYGPIRNTWAGLGWESVTGTGLGYPLNSPQSGLRDSGVWQGFEKGGIYSSAGAGTHVLVNGPVRDYWVRQDYEKGALGYAVTDLNGGLRNGGSWQGFEHGGVYSSPAGTYGVLSGPVRALWAALGFEQARPGSLGYPVNATATGLLDGGSWQGFEAGAIYDSRSTGAHVLLNGPIRDYWMAQNYEKGSLGYPTGESYSVPGGSAQRFQGGVLTLNASTGVVTRTAP